jgi:hypothetical protein
MEKPYTCYSWKVIFLFLLTAAQVVAQKKYGNEWITPSQTYLRIPVTQTGMYKITALELQNAGFPLDSFQVSSLQLFRRGREAAIEIHHAGEKFSPQDYLIFYGQRNDGAMDSSLYVSSTALPHPYYSLYSDTASYFLTYSHTNITGKRIPVSEAEITTDLIRHHFNEVLQVHTSDYPAGNLYPMGSNYETGTALTTYDVGEGWTGKELFSERGEILKLSTGGAVTEKFGLAEVEVLLTGRSAGTHQVEIRAGVSATDGRKLASAELLNYNTLAAKISLTQQDIAADGELAISVVPVSHSGSVSVSYVKWHYPQKTSFAPFENQKTFHFNPEQKGKMVVLNQAGSWQFYDISDPYLLKKLLIQDSLLPIQGARHIAAFKLPLVISKPRLLRFRPIDPATDYLIVSHPLVRHPVFESKDPVEDYAAYRTSPAGGRFTPLILNSEEIFDRFNYGEPGPLGIRNAISYLHTRAALKFLLLLGRSIDPQTARQHPDAGQKDMIPSAGWPGSDIALAMGLADSSDFVPLVPVGRVHAATPENIYDYLRKVKAVESQDKAAPWRKNILHLSGGHTQAEREVYREYVDSFKKRIAGSGIGARVQTISKQTDALQEEFPLDTLLNKGLALITLYGHSGLSATDPEMGLAGDQKRNYKNDSLYPAVITNGCALGNTFFSSLTLSNNWILTPGKGAVLFLAHTHNGVSSSLKHYTDSFYEVLADSSFTSQPFGIIQQESIRRNMSKYPTLSDGITAQQMNLQGDPAIRIFPATLPDYSWNPALIQFSNPNGRTLAAKTDSIKIRIGILNHGRFRKDNVKIILQVKDSTQTETYSFIRPSAAQQDTLYFTVPNKLLTPGKEKWTFTIDPDHALAEENKENNIFSTELILPEAIFSDTLEITAAGVFPNPSENYLTFQITLKGSEPPKKWEITIFDNSGRTIEKRPVIPHLGKNDYVWTPRGLSGGAYLYRMNIEAPVIKKTAEAEKGMTGKFIWMY